MRELTQMAEPYHQGRLIAQTRVALASDARPKHTVLTAQKTRSSALCVRSGGVRASTHISSVLQRLTAQLAGSPELKLSKETSACVHTRNNSAVS